MPAALPAFKMSAHDPCDDLRKLFARPGACHDRTGSASKHPRAPKSTQEQPRATKSNQARLSKPKRGPPCLRHPPLEWAGWTMQRPGARVSPPPRSRSSSGRCSAARPWAGQPSAVSVAPRQTKPSFADPAASVPTVEDAMHRVALSLKGHVRANPRPRRRGPPAAGAPRWPRACPGVQPSTGRPVVEPCRHPRLRWTGLLRPGRSHAC